MNLTMVSRDGKLKLLSSTRCDISGVSLLNGKFLSGQYTYKIYHLQSKVRPGLSLQL